MPPGKKATVEETRLEEGESVKSKEKAPVFVKSPQEKHLVRKINWTFMPLVCLILFVQVCLLSWSHFCLVRRCIQFIATSSLFSSLTKAPLRLQLFSVFTRTRTSHRHSTAGSARFFIWAFLLFRCVESQPKTSSFITMPYFTQAPNQYFLQRVQISKYLGSILIIWGVCLACTAVAKDFGQLAGLRILLGFFEGTTYPCIFLLISTLYRRSEQVIWFGVMFITNAFAIAVGSLVGFGIGLHMDGTGGMRAWKWYLVIDTLHTVRLITNEIGA